MSSLYEYFLEFLYLVKATVPHLETGYPNPSKPVTPGTSPAMDAMFITLPPEPPF